MRVYIVFVVQLLVEINAGPFLSLMGKERDLNVIDGSFIRQAFRVLEDQDYEGTSNWWMNIKIFPCIIQKKQSWNYLNLLVYYSSFKILDDIWTCLNGGTVKDNVCSCTEEYIGPRCEMKIPSATPESTSGIFFT